MNWQAFFEKEMAVLIPLGVIMAFMLFMVVRNCVLMHRRFKEIEDNTIREVGWNEAKEIIADHWRVEPKQVMLTESGFRIMQEDFE